VGDQGVDGKGHESGGIFVLGKQKEYIPKQVLEEMAEEGISREQVIKLLTEIEMIDECREDVEMEELVTEQEEMQETWMEVIESLPHDILPSAQELKDNNSERMMGGYDIPDAPESWGSVRFQWMEKGAHMLGKGNRGKRCWGQGRGPNGDL
jgi:hypothetical protein